MTQINDGTWVIRCCDETGERVDGDGNVWTVLKDVNVLDLPVSG